VDERIYQVLLIEDNLADNRLIREFLRTAESQPFALAHVERLADGLHHLETQPTDIVLLDLSLPDSYGWESFDRLHSAAPAVPIVILTGLQDESLARKAASSGAQDYLVKGEINGSLLTRTLSYAIERQQLLQKQQTLNRNLAVLSEVNQAVVRAKDEQALLDEVCTVIANLGGYRLVWVGIAEMDTPKRIFPMAWAGPETAYLQRVNVEWGDTELGRGPTGTAVRAGRPFIVHDVQQDPIFIPWRRDAADHGIRAMIALPLLKDGAAFGVLDIYSAEGDRFDATEVALLTELASDLAYGIDARRTNEALRQSEEKFATAFHNSTIGMMIASVPSNEIIDVNDGTLALFGYDRSEVIGCATEKLNIWVDQKAQQQIGELLSHGHNVHDLELEGRSKTGDRFHVLVSFDQIELHNEPCILTIMHDITARKQTEKALHQAQQLAQTTINALTAHIAVLDEEGTIVAVNQSWRDFAQANNADLQRTNEGINYLAVSEAVSGEEAAEARQFAADIRAVINGVRDSAWLEYPCHAPHEPRWFIARATPIMAGNSTHRWVVVAHENITDLKLAEVALRDSANHYRLLFDSNPLPMWVYDLETLVFLAVNDAALAKYGYTRDAFLKMKLDAIQRPSDTLASHFSGERQHRLQDGRLIEVEISADTLDYNGRAAALMTAFDITERKRAAQERITQAQRMQQVLDTMPEGVILLDSDRRILNMNPTAEQLLPALTTAQVTETVTQIGGQPIDSFLAATQTGADWHEVEAPAENRLFALTAQPILVGKIVSGWVLVLREVTEERKRLEHLQMQQRLATVGQLAAGIAHDFNNIMAVITLYSDLLTQNPDHERRIMYLQTIHDQANHAARLIRQILDFSRRSVMTRSKLDLRPFVKELVKLWQRTLPETIDITFVEPDGQFLVEADLTHLQQALMNLAVNARDAMPEGGALQIALNALSLPAGKPTPVPEMAPGDWISLSVTDTGSGIPTDNLPHLFEPFFTTKKPGQGTGLGLSQVYGIVKQHNGEITVDSQVGAGATFTIYLPALSTAGETAVDNAASPLRTGQGQTILLVEDNDTARKAIAEVLESLNYKVLEAVDGATALRFFTAHADRIALIVTDMVMPKMGGSELYTRLRAINQDVKVVVVTGYPLEESGQKLLSEGIVAWIQKPFSAERLAAIIHEVLD